MIRTCEIMKVSTEIGSIAKVIGEEKAVEYVAKAGFDAWDFSMFRMCITRQGELVTDNDHPLAGKNYAEFARKLRKIGEDNGIICNQTHAPFPTKYEAVRSYIERALECTAIVGAEICVVHPQNLLSAEENAEMYREFLVDAHKYGVKIATENMWCWDGEKDESAPAACSFAEDFCRHIDVVNDDYFVACLDIGHAEMRGSSDGAAYTIRALGDRLQALHIHDNDQWKDSHAIPFSMKVDFEEIVRALKDINYKGYLTLEATRYIENFTEENAFEGVKDLYNAVDRMRKMF